MILWDISHLEFTITDYYYFSELKAFLEEKYEIREGESLGEKELSGAEWLVLNYPEKLFSEAEKKQIFDYVEDGGNLFVTAYFKNEDGVASILNNLLEEVGIVFRFDEVKGAEGTPLISTTSLRTPYAKDVNKVWLPCTCSLEVKEGEPLALSEEDHKSNLTSGSLVYAAFREWGKGKVFAFGTAVFWDNFSINREDNRKLIGNIFGIK